MAYAHVLGLDGRGLLTAVIAANECAARITAAATLGRFRGQNAPHTHLAGAVSGRLRAEGAPAEDWINALGIAFSMPPWPSLRAFLGTDARVLSAAMPVRMGLDACDAARAGLAGPRDILEHPDGFLATFEAPFGEALRQAGPRAAKWLEEVGTHWLVDLAGELPARCESFETATKAMPARVEVRLRTGETHAAERSIPVGAIGPDTRAHHHDIVRAKFLAVGGPAPTADIAANLPAASAAQVREMLSLALH